MAMVLVGLAPAGSVVPGGDFLRRAGGELMAEEVGDDDSEGEGLMSTGSTRVMGGLTDWLGEMLGEM